MARIKSEDIDRVRQSVDIVDVISQYIAVEKKGRNFAALCPFHDDSNPSLTISSEKQIYKCFVCGAGGNVFTFIQNYKHVSFVEAVDSVARHANINLNLNLNNFQQNKFTKDEENYYKIMEDASNFLNYSLLNSKNNVVLNYLDKRDLNNKELKYFDVGYENDHSLVKFLKRKGYKKQDLIEINLVNEYEQRLVSVFNNRLVFPIHNKYEKIVGFSGRILHSDSDSAKYVNSNENTIYTKGDVVYNLHRAKDSAKRQQEVFLVEGVFDVIAFYKADVFNSVATLGTALTKNQAQQISTLSKNVVIAFDGDAAGQMASVKSIEILLDYANKIEVMQGFKDLDPDDYLKEHKKTRFNEALKMRVSWMDFLIKYFNQKYNLDNFEERKEFTITLVKFLKKIKDKFDKQYFLEEIEKITKFNKNQIQQLLPKDENKVKPQKVIEKKVKIRNHRVEFNILGQMLSGKLAAFYIRDNLGFIADEKLNRLYLLLIDYFNDREELIEADVISKINNEDSELLDVFLEIVNNDSVIKKYNKKIIDENIGLIEVKLIERNIRELRKQSSLDDQEQALKAKKIAELNLRKSKILEK